MNNYTFNTIDHGFCFQTSATLQGYYDTNRYPNGMQVACATGCTAEESKNNVIELLKQFAIVKN